MQGWRGKTEREELLKILRLRKVKEKKRHMAEKESKIKGKRRKTEKEGRGLCFCTR